jgi:hypothetical protein
MNLEELKKSLGNQRLYLYVPYEQKDYAKSVGCKWSPEKKQWYHEGTTDEVLKAFTELGWLTPPPVDPKKNLKKKIYAYVYKSKYEDDDPWNY